LLLILTRLYTFVIFVKL